MGAPVGNRNNAKGKAWEEAIRKALAQHSDKQALFKIATGIVDKALAGDQFSITELGNRLDGKPAQSMEMSGSLETGQPARELTADELRAEARILRAALGIERGTDTPRLGNETVN